MYLPVHYVCDLHCHTVPTWQEISQHTYDILCDKLLTCFALLMLQIRYMQVSAAVLVTHTTLSANAPSPLHFKQIIASQENGPPIRLVTFAWWQSRDPIWFKVWLEVCDFSSRTSVLTDVSELHPPPQQSLWQINFCQAGFAPHSSDFFFSVNYMLERSHDWTSIFTLLAPVYVLSTLVISCQMCSRWLTYLFLS